jgi:hypothetical protein
VTGELGCVVNGLWNSSLGDSDEYLLIRVSLLIALVSMVVNDGNVVRMLGLLL